MNIPLMDLKDVKHSREFFDTKPSHWGNIFIFMVLGIFLGTFLWAAFFQIDDVIKADASLRPQGIISALRSPISGQVIKKYFTQGQLIAQGELLWEMDSSADRVDLANTQTQIDRAAQSLADCNTLEDTIFKNRNMAKLKFSPAWNRGEFYIAEQSRLQVNIKKAQYEIEKERNLPAAMATLQTVKNLEMVVSASTLELVSFQTKERVGVQDERARLLEAKESLVRRKSELERRIKDATITSPIAGRLEETQRINVGDYVNGGQEIARIVPQSETVLKVELIVSPGDIAKLKPGLKVLLRLAALPPSEFGELSGTITLMPSDVTIGLGNLPCFIVEAELEKPWLQGKNGEKIYLRVGMSAKARIIVDRQSILKMILKKMDFIK